MVAKRDASRNSEGRLRKPAVDGRRRLQACWRGLHEVLASRTYLVAVVLAWMLVCFLDAILDSTHEPFAPRSVVWGVAAGAASVMAIDTLLHLALGVWGDAPELRSPLPYVLDVIPVVSVLLVWPNLYDRTYRTTEPWDPVEGSDLLEFFRGVSDSRAIVSFLVLPVAFLKVVVAAWRHDVLASHRSSQRAQGPGASQRMAGGNWTQWLMLLTASSCLAVLVVTTLVVIMPQRFSAEADTLSGIPNGLENAVKTSPLPARQALAPFRFIFAEAEEVGAPVKVVTHQFLRGELTWKKEGVPDGDALTEFPPALWVESRPDGLILLRMDWRRLFLERLGNDTLRKSVPLMVCVVLLVLEFYLASLLMLRPMERLLESLVASATTLDEKGRFHDDSDGRPVGHKNMRTLECALERVDGFLCMMQKAFEGGGVVMQRLLTQVAGGESGEGQRAWADFYYNPPLALAPRSTTAARHSRGAGPAMSGSEANSLAEGRRTTGDAKRSSAASGKRRGPARAAAVSASASGDVRSGDGGRPRISGMSSDDGMLEPSRSSVPHEAPKSWDWSSLLVAHEGSLGSLVVEMFRDLGLCNDGNVAHHGTVPLKRLRVLVGLLEGAYRADNPYHNWEHAVDVTHGMYMMLRSTAEARGLMRTWDSVALMVAALAHDVGHRGTNNAFLVATRDELALRYNDVSVQENMHAATLYELMVAHPEADVFAGLDQATWTEVRATVVTAVMGTDMAVHFDMIAKVETAAEAADWARRGSETGGGGGGEAAQRTLGVAERKLLLQVLLHTADLSSLFKGPEMVVEWTRRVVREFFDQGAMEKELGMVPQALMVEGATYVPGSQMEFYEVIMRPYVSAVATWLPSVGRTLAARLARSYAFWGSIVEADQAGLSAPAPGAEQATDGWHGCGAPISSSPKYSTMNVKERVANFNAALGVSADDAKQLHMTSLAEPLPSVMETPVEDAEFAKRLQLDLDPPGCAGATARSRRWLERASCRLAPAMASWYWFGGVLVVSLFIPFLDICLETSYDPWPPQHVVWAVAAAAAAVLAGEAALQFLVGVMQDVNELREPYSYALDTLAVGSVITWAAMTHLVYKAVSPDNPLLGKETTMDYVNGVVRNRGIVTYLVMPLVFLKAVSAAWRHKSLRQALRSARHNRRSEKQRAVGDRSHGWTMALMLMTAASCLCLLLMMMAVEVLPDPYKGSAFIIWRFPNVVANSARRSPNGPVRGSPLFVTLAALERTHQEQRQRLNPQLATSHMWVRPRLDPDLPLELVWSSEERSRTTGDPRLDDSFGVYAYSPSPPGAVLQRWDFGRLFLADNADDALRKSMPLILCVVLLLVNFYFACEMLVRPVRDLLQAIVARAPALDSKGLMAGIGATNDSAPLTLPDALARIEAFIVLMHKANQGGAVVMKRLLKQVASEDGSVTSATNDKRAWAKMYAAAPAARDPETDRRPSVMRLPQVLRREKSRAAMVRSEHARRTASMPFAPATGKPAIGGEQDVVHQLMKLRSWTWSSLSCEHRDVLGSLVVEMFRDLGLCNDGNVAQHGTVPLKRLRVLVGLLEGAYRADNPYHNWEHAVDVTHGMYMMLRSTAEARGLMRTWDSVALMVAALAHDVGHRGTNNAFLVATRDELALRYNDVSVQENMHAATLYELMVAHPEADVFAGLDQATWTEVRATVVTAVMGTDMAVHFDMIAKVETAAEAADWARRGSETGGGGGGEAAQRTLGVAERKLLLQVLLHTADLSSLFKGPEMVVEWTRRVVREFFDQGAMEKELGMVPQALMVEGATYVPGSQMEFYEVIMRPYVSAVATWLPSVGRTLAARLARSYAFWGSIVEADQAAAAGTPVPSPFAHALEACGARITEVPKYLTMRVQERIEAFRFALEPAAAPGQSGSESTDTDDLTNVVVEDRRCSQPRTIADLKPFVPDTGADLRPSVSTITPTHRA
ncbi:unnamed protein product [Pedinophyceae sp. YPF-701]|nr:unnamed protein product [Pedinophyceae sp. YPF-701]